MWRKWIYLFAVLSGLAMPGVFRVGAMEVYTKKEMEAVNGTDVRLKCTFKSSAPLSASALSVSWNFRPLGKRIEESVFFYQEIPFPPQDGRFKGRAVWSGDVLKQDGSIILQDVQFSDNGTYSCAVRNPPDVHGVTGEVSLKVVQKVSFSEIGMLAAGVGGAIAVVLLILIVFVTVKFCRRRKSGGDLELREREAEWKDPTACKPEEAIHLKLLDKEPEIDSSDGEMSEASSGGGEEDDNEEKDDDDDDDGGDDDDD